MTEKMKKSVRDKGNVLTALACGIVLTLGLYVYFVCHTVYAVAERSAVERSITTIENSNQKLESQYISLKNSITEDYARGRGFVNIADTKYISRGPLGQGISFNKTL